MSTTFHFTDPFERETDANKQCWCKITIKVIFNKTSGNYHISYKNKFSNQDELKDNEVNKADPFYYDENLIEHKDGDIIVKNKMTTTMLEFLLMEDTELEKYTGNTDVSEYRKIIMGNIARLWD